jgi:uncharacterized protein (TIGR00369 family)
VPKVTIERMNRMIAEGLPFAAAAGILVEALGPGSCTMRLPANADFARPGGTLSGPAMMGLADAAMWVALMSKAGEMQMAVTTSFNINFLRKPPIEDVIAESRAIKIGKRLAVLEATLFTADRAHEPIAHATGTYSIPPEPAAQ